MNEQQQRENGIIGDNAIVGRAGIFRDRLRCPMCGNRWLGEIKIDGWRWNKRKERWENCDDSISSPETSKNKKTKSKKAVVENAVAEK